MSHQEKQFRIRNVLLLAIDTPIFWMLILVTMTFFLRLVELVVPKLWKGKYHAFIIRMYSNFPSAAFLWEFPLRLFKMNLSQAKLSGANLVWVTLRKLDMSEADFTKADLQYANFMGANLSHANLSEANLSYANLVGANLSSANLSGAKLIGANLSNANLTEAQLIGTSVYAISAWNVRLDKTLQTGLIITRDDEATITVDNLEVAQFIYLLLNNHNIRDVIDTITSKVVLILGRFTPERKAVLDAIRKELRKRNYSPVLFDFEKPSSRDITETVSTLAHIARFVIADLTDAKSIPQELSTIVPHLPSVPVQPLLLSSQREYGMYEHFTRFPWVLPIYHYTDEVSLLQYLKENIIEPTEQKAKEFAQH